MCRTTHIGMDIFIYVTAHLLSSMHKTISHVAQIAPGNSSGQSECKARGQKDRYDNGQEYGVEENILWTYECAESSMLGEELQGAQEEMWRRLQSLHLSLSVPVVPQLLESKDSQPCNSFFECCPKVTKFDASASLEFIQAFGHSAIHSSSLLENSLGL